jgi:hypothetical protein
MQPGSSLPYSQNSTTSAYSKPSESNPQTATLFAYDPFLITFSQLCLDDNVLLGFGAVCNDRWMPMLHRSILLTSSRPHVASCFPLRFPIKILYGIKFPALNIPNPLAFNNNISTATMLIPEVATIAPNQIL